MSRGKSETLANPGVEFPPDVIEPYHELAAQNTSFKNQTVRWAHRALALEEALHHLVALKDGPRDDAYRAQKDDAWHKARVLLDKRRSGDA